MSKKNTRFVCSSCGSISLKWQGKCPECENWNTIQEEIAVPERFSGILADGEKKRPQLLTEITTESHSRISTHIEELDRVLGGGIVPGSVTLVGGPPGIGKSTLLLQVARGISAASGAVLYVSGEESSRQIKLRANRLEINSQRIYLLSETCLENILEQISELNPAIVIIDSIQTVYRREMDGAPGSVGQVRESTSALVRMAKQLDAALFIVGHVTKDGAIAGPRVLEHLVDTVLYFEGENIQNFRVIRAVKNRFGSTNEVGIFEMHQKGLQGLKNPSAYFLAQRTNHTPGSVIVPVIEGSRAILVEVQALATKSYYGIPTRKTKGIDINRLALIIAVIEKRAGIQLSASDIFVNVVGGMDLDEPAVDLGLAMAIISSLSDIPVEQDCLLFGEVGLGGEIRGVSSSDRRILEGERLGFSTAWIPEQNASGEFPPSIRIEPLQNIRQATELIFGSNVRKHKKGK